MLYWDGKPYWWRSRRVHWRVILGWQAIQVFSELISDVQTPRPSLQPPAALPRGSCQTGEKLGCAMITNCCIGMASHTGGGPGASNKCCIGMASHTGGGPGVSNGGSYWDGKPYRSTTGIRGHRTRQGYKVDSRRDSNPAVGHTMRATCGLGSRFSCQGSASFVHGCRFKFITRRTPPGDFFTFFHSLTPHLIQDARPRCRGAKPPPSASQYGVAKTQPSIFFFQILHCRVQ